ncbi:hypothetical protein Ddye_025846 [Dipteronia dyeriana]|uniref:Reverse transcriptase domain-containing protein n=1 Tax=Dipteronia dyeriana TaxID=168575 RepID=A0AAD9TL54_9ROSI|nr:hypothetical protein Ddye_025846 [Dipteronia dyeriana]
MKPRTLRLQSWTQNFNPNTQRTTNAKIWVWFYDLPWEFWHPQILSDMTRGIRIPLKFDRANLEGDYGHFARMLIDVDLSKSLHDSIMIEVEDDCLFPTLFFENVPSFCSVCCSIDPLHTEHVDIDATTYPIIANMKALIDHPRVEPRLHTSEGEVSSDTDSEGTESDFSHPTALDITGAHETTGNVSTISCDDFCVALTVCDLVDIETKGVFHTRIGRGKRGPRPFRFQGMWVSHLSFLNLVRSVWSSSITGNGNGIVVQKLKLLKKALRKWNWEVFGDITLNVTKANEKMMLIQGRIDSEVLIPLTLNALLVEQFRPIALGNFLFKVITKIIVDRLTKICSRIISSNQSGFIRGRQIGDCIVGASKCFNVLNNCSRGGHLALKIDIRKVFDSISWPFIFEVLLCFGFSENFIGWVASIFDSARISVLINGSPQGYCLVEDFLSRYFTHLVDSGSMTSISSPVRIRAPSHFLYVDGVILFCRASPQNLQGGDLMTYLRVPLFIGAPKRRWLIPWADKIKSKLESWKGFSLSMTGLKLHYTPLMIDSRWSLLQPPLDSVVGDIFSDAAGWNIPSFKVSYPDVAYEIENVVVSTDPDSLV